uniref:Uncharacterized protein n=1 Tax=Romanomermis culicivorax TaxID=13658 RepID=A0A915L4N0_ROMCU
MENDIIDNILQIGGPSYVGDNVLSQRFQSFYESRYGLSDVHLQPISLLYMIYSSILALPLTNKMEKYQIEGILLRKAVRTMKLVVSHHASNREVSLKEHLIEVTKELRSSQYGLDKEKIIFISVNHEDVKRAFTIPVSQMKNVDIDHLQASTQTFIEEIDVQKNVNFVDDLLALDNFQENGPNVIKSIDTLIKNLAVEKGKHTLKSYIYGQLMAKDSNVEKRIPDLNPDEILSHLETCSEEYQSIKGSKMELILSSIKSDLSGKLSQLTDADIMHFFQGYFSGYKLIPYAHDFLGVMNEESKPLFISTVATQDHQKDSEKQLEEVAAQYILDYAHSEGRRHASFICIGHNTQDLGLMKFTTFGKHKQTFERCILGIGYHRKKRANSLNIVCPAEEKKILDEETKLGNIKRSLQTVSKVSQILMTAQIFKSMISALIRKDYKEFALNTAFLVSGPLMESLSIRLMTQGAKMSSVLAGRSLMIAAPFLARLPMSGFVVYDLLQQIKDFKAGNLDAKVNVIGDSSILAIEFASASVEGMEAVGLISGIADVFGPVGFTISTAIFIGTDIYSAVKSVEKINQIVHLTTWQRFQTGFLAFWHLPPTKSVQKKLDEKIIADLTHKNAARFFEQYAFVGYYFFPAYKVNGKFIENNSLNLVDKKGVTTSKVPGLLTPICTKEYINYECKQMVGYRNTCLNNLTVILLGNGTDRIKTFTDKSTTFLIGNGIKSVVGSRRGDTFILNGETTEGYLNGHAGLDTLNAMHFSVDNHIYFNITNNTLRYLNKILKVFNINNFIGRPNARDIIECSCRTSYNSTDINVINVTLDKALAGNNSDCIIVNMRRPMRIMYNDKKIFLAPIDYYLKNSSYTLIHKGLIEPYTTIVIEKYLINYETFTYKNTSLILTNVNFVEVDEDLVLLILEKFSIEKELQTLRIKFEDQTLLLNTMLEEIRESEEFEDWSSLDDQIADLIEIRD